MKFVPTEIHSATYSLHSARRHSMRFSFYSKKPCHVANHQLCSLEYTDIFIPFVEAVWPLNPLYFLV